jgi:hypothetical protein
MAMGDDPALMDKSFELTSDIDMDPNVTGVPPFTHSLIGSRFSPFVGLFWGKYYKIKNLKFIISADYIDSVGLFYQLGEYNGTQPSTVWMLTVENCTVLSERSYVGIIAGVNYGSIGNCRVTGHVEGENYVGAIAGYNSNMTGGIVYCTSDASVYGGECVGGLVGGGGDNSIVVDSYAAGTVWGQSRVGGIAGHAKNCLFKNCYSIANVSGASLVGGFVGDTSYSPQIRYCYFLNTAGPDNDKGTPLTEQQMKQKASYIDWEFAPVLSDDSWHVWRLCQDGGDWPHLFWEFIARGDFGCSDGIGTEDLEILAENWLEAASASLCDINSDGYVNIEDFLVLSQHWLEN